MLKYLRYLKYLEYLKIKYLRKEIIISVNIMFTSELYK